MCSVVWMASTEFAQMAPDETLCICNPEDAKKSDKIKSDFTVYSTTDYASNLTCAVDRIYRHTFTYLGLQCAESHYLQYGCQDHDIF